MAGDGRKGRKQRGLRKCYGKNQSERPVFTPFYGNSRFCALPRGTGNRTRIQPQMDSDELRWEAGMKHGIDTNAQAAWNRTQIASSLAQLEILDDLHGAGGFVEGVHVQAGNAVAEEFGALARRVFDAKFRGGGIVVADFLERLQQGRGQFGTAQLGEALDLVRAHDGDDARHDGHAHTEFRQVVTELEEIRV